MAEIARLWSLIRQLQGRTRGGTGSPEGVVAAPVGTLYLDDAGGAGTTLYVKESGTGDTGWVVYCGCAEAEGAFAFFNG